MIWRMRRRRNAIGGVTALVVACVIVLGAASGQVHRSGARQAGHTSAAPAGAAPAGAASAAAPDGPRALSPADAVTVHPYGSLTASFGWHNAVGVHDDVPTLPVWITEVGYRVGDTLDGATVTGSVRSSAMQKTLTDYASWSWQRAYLWFKWEDYPARAGP
jgi:hypothetical protein